MDTRLVQIIGDGGAMGQLGALVLPPLLRQEGKNVSCFLPARLPRHDLYGCVPLEATVCAQIEG